MNPRVELALQNLERAIDEVQDQLPQDIRKLLELYFEEIRSALQPF